MITFPSLSLSLQTMSRDTGQHRKCETVRVKEEPLKSQKNGGKTRSRCCVATRCPAAGGTSRKGTLSPVTQDCSAARYFCQDLVSAFGWVDILRAPGEDGSPRPGGQSRPAL